MLAPIGELPVFDFGSAVQSGPTISTDDLGLSNLKCLILAGDYIGVHLYTKEINSIEDEIKRSNKMLDELDLKKGYKGGLKANHERLNSVGDNLMGQLVRACYSDDHVTTGELLKPVLKETLNRMKAQYPEIHKIAIELRTIYRNEVKAELAKLRAEQDS